MPYEGERQAGPVTLIVVDHLLVIVFCGCVGGGQLVAVVAGLGLEPLPRESVCELADHVGGGLLCLLLLKAFDNGIARLSECFVRGRSVRGLGLGGGSSRRRCCCCGRGPTGRGGRLARRSRRRLQELLLVRRPVFPSFRLGRLHVRLNARRVRHDVLDLHASRLPVPVPQAFATRCHVLVTLELSLQVVLTELLRLIDEAISLEGNEPDADALKTVANEVS